MSSKAVVTGALAGVCTTLALYFLVRPRLVSAVRETVRARVRTAAALPTDLSVWLSNEAATIAAESVERALP